MLPSVKESPSATTPPASSPASTSTPHRKNHWSVRLPTGITASRWSASGLRSVSGDPRSDHCLSHPAPVFAPARPRTAPLGLVGATRDRWWHRIGLFGVGGALIVPPALTAFFGVRQVEGQGG